MQISDRTSYWQPQTTAFGSLVARFLVAMILLMPATGCSIIGLGIGYGQDSGRPRTQVVPAAEVWRFPAGDSLVLHLHDGTRMGGRLLQLTEQSDEEYRIRYDEWLAAGSGSEGMPRPGDHVGIVSQSTPASRTNPTGEGKFVASRHNAAVCRSRRGG